MKILITIILLLGFAASGFAMPPEEFEAKWSKTHHTIATDKQVDMIRYTVKAFHFWHIKVRALKFTPDGAPGSKAWIVKRIVHKKADAIILYLTWQPKHMFDAGIMPAACVEFSKEGPKVVWQSDQIKKTIIKTLLRKEGHCPI